MTEAQIFLFVVTSLIVIITPGQDMVLVMSRSVAQGSKAGVATAAGVSTGLLGHTALAGFGLGALLRASEMLFVAVKVIGAVYLFYLGAKLLRTRQEELELSGAGSSSLRALFVQGAISNLANPKIAIFYLAFLPQFIEADALHPTSMLLALGVAFAVLTFIVKAPIGYGAGALSSWMRARPKIQVWLHRISGGVLIALSMRLVLERRL
ncbi:MAG: LysE family translocator [Gammaproteobacteria bacterium]|nr:LysE family translocator [Gammaproteobacteria bacterium]